MKLSIQAATSFQDLSADWLVLPVWEEGLSSATAMVDRQLNGKLTRLRESEDVKGKTAELVPLLNPEGMKAQRLLILGLGKRADLTRAALTKAGYAAAKNISSKKRGRVAIALPNMANGLTLGDVVLAL